MATHLKMLGVSTCCCNILLLSLLIVLNKSCTINSYQNKFIFRSSQRIERNNIRSTVIANENLFTCSTVISPPKVDKTKKKGVGVEVPISPDIFKENRDIQKEFDNYGNDDKYAVILYNDPFNKRIYVATCLMEVFTWTEEMAADIMMQAHTYGLAVLGEWVQEIAEEYSKQLTDKGLVVSVHKSSSDK